MHISPSYGRPKYPEQLASLIKEPDAAAFLGITPKKLRRLGYEKRGPHSIKIGRDRLYPREDFLEWVASLSA